MTSTPILFALIAGLAAPGGVARAADAPPAVPSGQPITLIDTLDQPGPAGVTARFRFLAPSIARAGGTIDYGLAGPDMQVLCDSYALQHLPPDGAEVTQVIISLSDIEVAFGQPTPEATQFFEAYSIADGVCIWEPL